MNHKFCFEDGSLSIVNLLKVITNWQKKDSRISKIESKNIVTLETVFKNIEASFLLH